MKKVSTGFSSSGAGAKVLKRERLLYVEDDDDNFHVAELRLRDCYELVRAASAAEACRKLRDASAPWAAVLMDIELRGSDLDGVELTKLLRGRLRRDSLPPYAKDMPTSDVPIIFVTAHGAKYSDAVLVLAGGDKIIQKPVDFGALNIALTQLHLSSARSKSRNA
jgi:CheY-like chemotaxis protein